MSESVIKSVKKKVIDWEASIAATNLNQKNIYYIEKEKNQKKKIK